MNQKILFVLLVLVVSAPHLSAQQWELQKQIGGSNNNYGSCIAFDSSGNRYVAGVTRGKSEFDQSTLYGGAAWCAYVAKYDAHGALLWIQAPGVCTDSLSDIYLNALAVDPDGNLYIAGKYLGSASFFGVPRTSIGASEIYIAKMSTNGEKLWIKTAGGVGQGAFGQNSANALGNCYVTGSYNKSIMFDTIPVSSASTTMLFIAKYDRDGHVIWAQSGESTSPISLGAGIASQPDGTSTLTGTFFGNLTIGSFPLDAVDAEQKMFIARCDPSGNVLWAHEVGSGGYYGNAKDVALDARGNACIAGSFRATIDFGGGLQFSYNHGYIYIALVAKYDTNGSLQWANATDGSDQASTANKIAVETTGYAVITGSFQHETSFGGTTLIKPVGSATFVAGLDANGKFISARAVEGLGSNVGNALAFAPTGEIGIVGEFQDTITLGPYALISHGGSDVFSALLTSGVNEVREAQTFNHSLELYPNPASRTLHATVPVNLSVVDILGRTVRECRICDAIDLQGLPDGVYSVDGTPVVVRH